ncbi:MAG: TSUP family transporter [Methylobacter sp.]
MSIFEYVWLFLGAFLAAAISGAAGFGGALLLLPLLARTVGAELAVPLLTFAQLVGNLSRVVLGFRQIHWRPVALFLGMALPAAILGAFSFVFIPKALAIRFIGIAILGFVILRITGKLRFVSDIKTLVFGGLLTGFISGLVGSAGPLGAAVFLSLGLPPVAYIASEAVTALALHATKLMVYQQQLQLSEESWQLAFLLGIGMMLGTWASKRVIERLAVERFQQFVTVLLAIIAAQMVVFG